MKKTEHQRIGSFGLKSVNLLVFAAAIFFIPTTVNAQTTLEQQCYDAVQGKVAYDQAGHKSWSAANVRKLCEGTTDTSYTISCFQKQINNHDNWSVAIEACK